MKKPFGSRPASRRGISEIFGALMLIIVVVVAVGTIAVFISQTEKQAQDRQNFQDSVKAEKLDITAVQFYPNSTRSDFELDNGSRYVLEYLNESQVSINDGTVCNIVGGTYSHDIKPGSTLHAIIVETPSPCTLQLGSETATRNLVINQARILNATFDVRNSNIQDSYICATAINGEYSFGFNDINGAHHEMTSPYQIPAQESGKVILSYNSYNVAPERLSTLKATVYSCAANYFDTTYSLSAPVVQAHYISEDIGLNNKRTVPVFQSSTDDGKIRWRIDVLSNSNTNNDWTGNVVTKYVDGNVLTYRPESLFNSTEQKSLKITGPLHISMKSVSSTGLLASSPLITMPETNSTVPPVALNLNSTVYVPHQSNVTVQLTDLLGRSVSGAGVSSFIVSTTPYNATIADNTPFVLTNATGSAKIQLVWTGEKPGYAAYLSINSNGITKEIEITTS